MCERERGRHSKMLSTLHSSLDNTKNHIRNATINAKTTHNCDEEADDDDDDGDDAAAAWR